MSKALNIFSIATITVIVGLIAFPMMVAGTPYPCEAVARIIVKNAPKSNLAEPWNRIADELAVTVGTAYARNHGILACYRLIPVVLDKKNQDNLLYRKFTDNNSL